MIAKTTRKKIAGEVTSKWASSKTIISISKRYAGRLQRMSSGKNNRMEAKNRPKRRKITEKPLAPR